MKLYVHKYPLILTDDIFVSFGGQTGTTTAPMRTAAYQIAEMKTTSYLDTYLLPTIITGSWDFHPGTQFLNTDYGYVDNLLWARIVDPFGVELHVITGQWNYAAIHEDTYGYIYVQQCYHQHGLDSKQPYKFQMVYEAGLPTGVANQPNMLLALTSAAQLTLNEMLVVPANETTGDAGVVKFTSLQYSEERKKWKNTAFGASAKAAFIASLLDSTIKKARRAIMIGRL